MCVCWLSSESMRDKSRISPDSLGALYSILCWTKGFVFHFRCSRCTKIQQNTGNEVMLTVFHIPHFTRPSLPVPKTYAHECKLISLFCFILFWNFTYCEFNSQNLGPNFLISCVLFLILMQCNVLFVLACFISYPDFQLSVLTCFFTHFVNSVLLIPNTN